MIQVSRLQTKGKLIELYQKKMSEQNFLNKTRSVELQISRLIEVNSKKQNTKNRLIIIMMNMIDSSNIGCWITNTAKHLIKSICISIYSQWQIGYRSELST